MPLLAAEVPSRERGTWIVRPDGTMRTTFSLRPGITWHDGHALTAADFVFGHRVITHPEMQTNKAVIELTDRVEAVDDLTVPRAHYNDLKYRASFPGFLYAGISIEEENLLSRVNGKKCPREEDRWVGSSLGCYQNAENDRIIDALNTALDPAEQRLLWRSLMKLQSEDVPVLPMYFNLEMILFRDGVTGLRGQSEPKTGATWNVAEWDVN